MTEDTGKRKLHAEEEAESKKLKTDSDQEPKAVSPKESPAPESTNGSNKEPEKDKAGVEKEKEESKEEVKPEAAESKTETEDSPKKSESEDEDKGDPTTPQSSQESSVTKEAPTPKDPTPVFGSKSSFRDAFKKSTQTPDIFSSSSSSKDANESTASFGSNVGSSFGSRSKFGNAFQQALSRPSFLDTPESKTAAENEDDEAKPKSSQQYKQVDLEEKNVTTGEENEESVFSAKVKLFELDLSNIEAGWKERGVGPLHLNRSLQEPNEMRLVMRSQGLLRVVLNYKITAKTELLKGLEASLSPGKFLRLNSVVEGKVVQYLLKFGSETLRDELANKVEELQKKITENGKA